MAVITGFIEKIKFRNEDNGYTVLSVIDQSDGEEVIMVGKLAYAAEGDMIEASGVITEHPVYGQQLQIESCQMKLPQDEQSVERYLGSGAIKGIGAALAARIVRRFKADTLRIMEEEPERLAEVKGISEKMAMAIGEQIEAKKDMRQAMMFLQNYGISMNLAAKIYQEYGPSLYGIIRENPYRLADDIWGIGFKTADQIAEKLGIGKEKFVRLRSGILYTLNKLSEEGHCYALREQLIGKAEELLEVEAPELEMTLDEMLRTQDVIQDEEAIYLPPFYFSEAGCARRLTRLLLAERAVQLDADRILGQIRERSRISYDEIQLEAIRTAVSSKVMALTGGPGTGKTTTVKGIISAYQLAGCRVLLAAPTGRAAKRMSEAAGMEAKTIHRLLEYKPPEGYQKNGENPLEGDVLILDECSMIDIMLMYNLLKALPDSMTLILVGDTDQLPSVGAGNVLKDIIASGRIPVVRLTRIFRQAEGSRIIMNAHRINRGEAIDMRGGKDSDFFFASRDTNEEVVETLVRWCTKNLPQYYHVDALQDIQVLTPMQRGVCGAANLNQVLQAAMNPSKIFLQRGGIQYRLQDKVMQIRNDYDKEVFNGDIGVISKVDIEERELTVDFDGRAVVYDASELDELTLAYATTIHKAQGSEYPIVVMPFTMSHFVMLQRNLLYTGVTRAKKILVLIGERRAVYYAIHHVTTDARNTKLAQRLQETLAE